MSNAYNGIDISNWQRDLTDGSVLTGGGVRFVIAKLTEGRGFSDRAFDAHYNMCADAGIPMGAYVYSHATDAAGGKAEAQYALERLGGRALKLPLFLDIEAGILSAGKTALMASALAFGAAVKAAGCKWGVYASRSPWQTVLDADAVRAAGGVIWCAAYNSSGPGMDCDIWQRSSSGLLEGYGGNLDMNIMYNTALLDGADEAANMQPPRPAPKWMADMPPMATLCEGFGGGQVKVLQALLGVDGFTFEQTGVFDEDTKAAVRQYQHDNGLVADGIVGNQTWTALFGAG